MLYCIHCGRHVYLVQDLHGFQFLVVGPDHEPWGRAICDGH
jgi:hypothetical protein